VDDFLISSDAYLPLQADIGAGSRVTDREGMAAGDKSVTVSIPEKEILHKFHSNFPRMSVARARERGEKVEFEFRLYPNGENVRLVINHPKSTGNETRIYFKQGVFYPKPSDFWFLFERDGEIWIGSLSDREKLALSKGRGIDRQNGSDAPLEEIFQQAINAPPEMVSTVVTGYRRDAGVAREALSNSGYKCEMLPDMETFSSKITGKPYLEAHHLLPIFEQRHFSDLSLDTATNICILNPYAHKMLHHAPFDEIKSHLERLAEPREQFLNELGVTMDRLFLSYGGS